MRLSAIRFFLVVGGLTALLGCSSEAPTGPSSASSGVTATATNPVLPPSWHCADGVTSTRSNNSTAIYTGSAPQDPGFCLATINGKTANSYLGFWDGPSSPAIRQAVAKIVFGPPGTTAMFDTAKGRVTLTVIDRNDYSFEGKTYPVVHYAYSPSIYRHNEVWMDATSGMFFRFAGTDGNWQITSLKTSNR